mgnify:CR=1 FL=1
MSHLKILYPFNLQLAKYLQLTILIGVFEQNLDISGKTVKTILTLLQLKAKVKAHKFPHTKKQIKKRRKRLFKESKNEGEFVKAPQSPSKVDEKN